MRLPIVEVYKVAQPDDQNWLNGENVDLAMHTSKRTLAARCTSMQHLVRQYGDLMDSLRDAQPVLVNERIGDVIGATQMIDQPRRCIQH